MHFEKAFFKIYKPMSFISLIIYSNEGSINDLTLIINNFWRIFTFWYWYNKKKTVIVMLLFNKHVHRLFYRHVIVLFFFDRYIYIYIYLNNKTKETFLWKIKCLLVKKLLSAVYLSISMIVTRVHRDIPIFFFIFNYFFLTIDVANMNVVVTLL